MADYEKGQTPKDAWDKLRAASALFGAVAVPLVIGLVGHGINSSLKEKDVRLRTVELAIGILQDDPKNNPEMPSLRQWAMNVIDEYSGIPIPEAARQELITRPLIGGIGNYELSCPSVPATVSIPNSEIAVAYEHEGQCTLSLKVRPNEDVSIASCEHVHAVVEFGSNLVASIVEDTSHCFIRLERAVGSG